MKCRGWSGLSISASTRYVVLAVESQRPLVWSLQYQGTVWWQGPVLSCFAVVQHRMQQHSSCATTQRHVLAGCALQHRVPLELAGDACRALNAVSLAVQQCRLPIQDLSVLGTCLHCIAVIAQRHTSTNGHNADFGSCCRLHFCCDACRLTCLNQTLLSRGLAQGPCWALWQ